MEKNLKTYLPKTETLIIERCGSVLTIWFNRPDARNALNSQMTNELVKVLDYARDELTLRTVIIRGAGGVFCSGGDIKDFKKVMQASDIQSVSNDNRSFGEVLRKLNEQPQVVIILVEGAAIGGGMGLACVGDITLVTRSARFRLSETSLGIPPAQIAPFVAQRIGFMQARRLMLTGAKFDGEKAFQIGLANDVFDDVNKMEEKCNEILDDINKCAPNANAATKRILFESLRNSMDKALDSASVEFAKCMLSDEGKEGVSAFIEKRAASWVETHD